MKTVRKLAALAAVLTAGVLIAVPVQAWQQHGAKAEATEDADAIRAFRKAFPGVSAGQARVRIDAEDDRADLIERLATSEPDTFGGSWYDGGTDIQHLQATTPEGAKRFGTLAADEGIHAEVHQVSFSHRELTAELDRLLAGAHPELGASARNHAGIDVRANRVVVGMGEETLARVRAQGTDLPPGVVLQPRTGETEPRIVPDACPSRLHCDRPLRSGLALWKGDPSRQACSLGFVASDRSDASRKYVLTAAHCGGIGDIFGHDNHEFGQVEQHHNDGDVDALAVRLDSTYWLNATFGWIYRPNGDGQPALPIDARIDSESSMQAGQTVCLSARNSTSGNRCGVLDAVNSDYRGMAQVGGLDACQGDSGGSWYRKSGEMRTAYGIHGESSDGCHTDDGVSYFSTLPTVQDTFGVDVVTRG